MPRAFFINTTYVPKGKTGNALYIKTALTRFLKVFKEKRLSCHRRSGSCPGTIPQCTPPSLCCSSWWRRRWRQSPTSPIWLISPQQTFSYSQSKIGAGWCDVDPGHLQEQLGRHCPDHHLGRHCCSLPAVDGALWQVRLDWWQLQYVKK